MEFFRYRSYPIQLGGRVSPSGQVQMKAVAGPRIAHGIGRFNRFRGRGTSAGTGPSGLCSGVWSAIRSKAHFLKRRGRAVLTRAAAAVVATAAPLIPINFKVVFTNFTASLLVTAKSGHHDELAWSPRLFWELIGENVDFINFR